MEPITTTDIIRDIILQQGYKNVNDFIEKNRLDGGVIRRCMSRNQWSNFTLKKIGRILRKDLSGLSTCNVDMGEDD